MPTTRRRTAAVAESDEQETTEQAVAAVLDAAKAAAAAQAAREDADLTRKERLKRYVARRVSSRMVSVASFCLGVAWLGCLPSFSIVTGEPKLRGTYFDETTLSPMASKATLHRSAGFTDYLKSMKNHSLFCDELRALNIECDHKYNTSFGIVRPASGWDAAEALAVVALNKNARPLVLALARFLASAPWLGKNVVVVAPDADLERWVRAYHNGHDDTRPFLRGGLLRGALLLRLPEAEKYGAATLKAHGFDGELPNLDFFHLVATAFPRLIHTESGFEDAKPPAPRTTYGERALALGTWARRLAGGSSGPHAHFLRRGIDAVTLEPSVALANARQTFDEARVGTGVELIVRSLNIVEHELHHGAAQYLLVDAQRFVSFDEVAFPLMLTALPLGVEAAKELALFAFDAIVLQRDIPHTIVTHFLYVISPMAFGGLAVYGCVHEYAPFVIGLLVCLAYVACLGVVSQITSDRRLARATVLLAAGYAHAPLVLSQPCLLLLIGAGATGFLTAMRPRADGGVRFALSLCTWLGLSPPVLAWWWGSWASAILGLRRDAVALGLPDRKLLYAGVGYVPVHAAALAYLLFAPERPADLDLDVELAKKEE